MHLLSYLLQLAELLGFSQLDLIQQLLTHRHEIVDSTLKDATALLKSGKCKIMSGNLSPYRGIPLVQFS